MQTKCKNKEEKTRDSISSGDFYATNMCLFLVMESILDETVH